MTEPDKNALCCMESRRDKSPLLGVAVYVYVYVYVYAVSYPHVRPPDTATTLSADKGGKGSGWSM